MPGSRESPESPSRHDGKSVNSIPTVDSPSKTSAAKNGERPSGKRPIKPKPDDESMLDPGDPAAGIPGLPPPQMQPVPASGSTPLVEPGAGRASMNSGEPPALNTEPGASTPTPMSAPVSEPNDFGPLVGGSKWKSLDVVGLAENPDNFSVTVFEGRNLNELRRLTGSGSQTAVGYSPSGDWLAVGDALGQAWLWSTKDPQRMTKVVDSRENPSEVTCFAFSPDEKTLLVGSKSGLIICVSLADAQHDEISQFAGHTSEVNKILVTGDGKKAISCGADRAVRIWTIEDGLPLTPRCDVAFDHDVHCLQATSAGRHIFASDGAVVATWDLGSKKPPAILQVSTVPVKAAPQSRWPLSGWRQRRQHFRGRPS